MGGNERKGKGKSYHSKSDFSQAGKKKDLSNIKCFHCHDLGHYATKCPHKKVDKNPSSREEGEALASQFKLDFTLIASMVTSVMGKVWYLDSGVSFYMTDKNEFFSDLEENDLQMHIKMVDDGRYSSTDISTIKF